MENPSVLLQKRKMAYRMRKQKNKEEFQKFFMAAYATETDEYCPLPWQEVFAGTGLVDIRIPGQGLEDRWPHYFKAVLREDSPDWKDYGPKSELFKQEFNELRGIVTAVRKVGDEWNRRADELLESLLMEQS